MANEEEENVVNTIPAAALQVSTLSGRLTLLPPLVVGDDGMILLLPTRRTIRVVVRGQVMCETTIVKTAENANDDDDHQDIIVAWCTGRDMNGNNLVILGFQSGMIQMWAILVAAAAGNGVNGNNSGSILLDHKITIPMPEAGGTLIDVSAAPPSSSSRMSQTNYNNNKYKKNSSEKQGQSPYPDVVVLIKVEANDDDDEDDEEDKEATKVSLSSTLHRYRVHRYHPTLATWQKVWTVPKIDQTGRWVRAFGANGNERGGIVVAGDSFLSILRGHGIPPQQQRLPCRLQDGHITCIAVSATANNNSNNGAAALWIAAGFARGSIRLYNGYKNHWIDHPPRRLHWHAHAVTSLAFGGGGNGSDNNDVCLHSVGEESVWIQWDNINDRPRNMLPRIAPTGIDHIVPMVSGGGPQQNNNMMLIHANNTILLYDCLTQDLVWRYQGIHEHAKIHGVLGGGGGSNNHPAAAAAKIVLSGSPGMLHIVDDTKRVQRTWRVAPYNRVSRMDSTAPEIPPPRLVHVQQHSSAASSSSSLVSGENDNDAANTSWWLTIHETVYESSPPNVMVQFWDRPDHCVSAMVQTEPIVACALQVPQAVLVTKTDIQLWDGIGCGSGSSGGSSSGGRATGTRRKGTEQPPPELPSCRTKIPIPAGFANQAIRANPVYSEDGSLLAIAFGRYITLWNPSSVRLLSTIPLIEDIEQMAFVMDGLVVRTQSEVSCLSILGNEHWQYDVVEATAMGTARDIVVVGNATSIVVLDSLTGEVTQTVKHNHGAITSMHVSLDRNHHVRIIATTRQGELLEIKDASLSDNGITTAASHADYSRVLNAAKKAAPTLPAFQESSKKRHFMEIPDMEDWCPSQIAPIEQLADDELPLLRGEFVMAFLGRNLRRKLQEASI
jgi:hypothetical protein